MTGKTAIFFRYNRYFSDKKRCRYIRLSASLFVACLLNTKMKGRGFFRALFFLPVIVSTGIVTATGDRADVRCRNNGDLTYAAILLPQQIPFANLIKVEWNGNSYILQNSFKLEAKKQYRLTIRLNKTQGGLDVGIDGWDIIDEDFGGTVG